MIVIPNARAGDLPAAVSSLIKLNSWGQKRPYAGREKVLLVGKSIGKRIFAGRVVKRYFVQSGSREAQPSCLNLDKWTLLDYLINDMIAPRGA